MPRFIRTEAAGGIALVTAAVIALVWANSPWRHGYEAVWHTRVLIDVGPLHLDEDLRHIVNEGLMALLLFFFVVGLEIKREATRGELANRRVAALPVFAAAGGMVVPAALYFLVARTGPAGHGWGIPMATDIAFALGVLALLGSRVPGALKLFLLTLAVVDDMGAIVVIALFYGGDIDGLALLVAAGAVASTVVLRRLRVDLRRSRRRDLVRDLPLGRARHHRRSRARAHHASKAPRSHAHGAAVGAGPIGRTDRRRDSPDDDHRPRKRVTSRTSRGMAS